jgi:predicted Zn-dependent peptidase
MTDATCQPALRIRKHVLDCGAVLLFEPNQSLRSAALTWWVPAGTGHDPSGDDTDGLAVMCAEMLERGAAGLDSRAFNDRLDRLGVIREVSVHPSMTRISASLRGENLAPTIDSLADLVLRPTFPDSALEPVRSLCVQAIDGLLDDTSTRASHALHRRALPAPFNRNGYGSRSVIEALDIQSIRDAWNARCRPVGSIISLAGAVDPDAVIEQLERVLSDWSGEALPLSERQSPIGGDEFLEQVSSQVHLELGFDGPLVDEDDELPFLAGVRALGSGASSRLFENVREKRGLCYDVHASYSPNKQFGLCTIGAGTTLDRVGQTLDCIMEQLECFGREGLEPSEFDRVRRGLKTRILMQGESTSVRAFALARDQHQRGAPRSLAELAENIDGLTHERVDQVVRSRMGGSWAKEVVRVAVGPGSPF